ncbi:hypothetical protein lerEdw1_013137 [Lerista edwardsae]|nr:hypothetical protein lerEdw1_013137 [Lerista edwardsae]
MWEARKSLDAMDVKWQEVIDLRARHRRRGRDSCVMNVELSRELQEPLEAEMPGSGAEETQTELAAGDTLHRAHWEGAEGGRDGVDNMGAKEGLNDDREEDEEDKEDENNREEGDEEARVTVEVDPLTGSGQATPEPLQLQLQPPFQLATRPGEGLELVDKITEGADGAQLAPELEEAVEEVEEAIEEAVEETVEEVDKDVEDTVEEVGEDVEETVEEVDEDAEVVEEAVEESVEEVEEAVEETVEEAIEEDVEEAEADLEAVGVEPRLGREQEDPHTTMPSRQNQCAFNCPPSTVTIQPPPFVISIPGPSLYCPDQPLCIEQFNPCASCAPLPCQGEFNPGSPHPHPHLTLPHLTSPHPHLTLTLTSPHLTLTLTLILQRDRLCFSGAPGFSSEKTSKTVDSGSQLVPSFGTVGGSDPEKNDVWHEGLRHSEPPTNLKKPDTLLDKDLNKEDKMASLEEGHSESVTQCLTLGRGLTVSLVPVEHLGPKALRAQKEALRAQKEESVECLLGGKVTEALASKCPLGQDSYNVEQQQQMLSAGVGTSTKMQEEFLEDSSVNQTQNESDTTLDTKKRGPHPKQILPKHKDKCETDLVQQAGVFVVEDMNVSQGRGDVLEPMSMHRLGKSFLKETVQEKTRKGKYGKDKKHFESKKNLTARFDQEDIFSLSKRDHSPLQPVDCHSSEEDLDDKRSKKLQMETTQNQYATAQKGHAQQEDLHGVSQIKPYSDTASMSMELGFSPLLFENQREGEQEDTSIDVNPQSGGEADGGSTSSSSEIDSDYYERCKDEGEDLNKQRDAELCFRAQLEDTDTGLTIIQGKEWMALVIECLRQRLKIAKQSLEKSPDDIQQEIDRIDATKENKKEKEDKEGHKGQEKEDKLEKSPGTSDKTPDTVKKVSQPKKPKLVKEWGDEVSSTESGLFPSEWFHAEKDRVEASVDRSVEMGDSVQVAEQQDDAQRPNLEHLDESLRTGTRPKQPQAPHVNKSVLSDTFHLNKAPEEKRPDGMKRKKEEAARQSQSGQDEDVGVNKFSERVPGFRETREQGAVKELLKPIEKLVPRQQQQDEWITTGYKKGGKQSQKRNYRESSETVKKLSLQNKFSSLQDDKIELDDNETENILSEIDENPLQKEESLAMKMPAREQRKKQNSESKRVKRKDQDQINKNVAQKQRFQELQAELVKLYVDRDILRMELCNTLDQEKKEHIKVTLEKVKAAILYIEQRINSECLDQDRPIDEREKIEDTEEKGINKDRLETPDGQTNEVTDVEMSGIGVLEEGENQLMRKMDKVMSVDVTNSNIDGEEVTVIDLTSSSDLNPPDVFQGDLGKATPQSQSEEVESNDKIQEKSGIVQDLITVRAKIDPHYERRGDSEEYYSA